MSSGTYSAREHALAAHESTREARAASSQANEYNPRQQMEAAREHARAAKFHGIAAKHATDPAERNFHKRMQMEHKRDGSQHKESASRALGAVQQTDASRASRGFTSNAPRTRSIMPSANDVRKLTSTPKASVQSSGTGKRGGAFIVVGGKKLYGKQREAFLRRKG